ncbi:putative ralA-binding protein 1 isoform X3 [Apostichopus japonicus]|uniref:Putative ralA-binding protein 1 isoform X3 n=1 Tax=Stichopus japonicus TaxID=307972 RepID=A0A2G8LCE0_STIJA|nr:putative ralA-binding protein 1 isoform X3 [Apostichopus japonicus]
MSSEKSANEKYKSKNSSLQDYKGQKKWSSRGELSSHSSATLEYPSKNSKKVGSLSDDEDERNNSKKKRKLFAFSSKSKRERNGSGDVKKKSKNKDEFSKDGGQKQRAARSNTISELSVAQVQKRLSREVKPIFGVELEDAVKQSKSLDGIELPLIIRECIDHVEGFGLDTPGIYRISGIKSKIEALKNSYNSGRGVDLKEYDVTVVTGLLKQYLRELPESVLTQELNSRFEEASAVPNDNLRVEEFLGVLNDLPTCNYTLLSWIIIHLVHVLDHADVNKMSIQNLSIVFSPTMRISHRVFFQLFTNWEIFFGHVKLKKCKKPLQLDSSGQVQLPDGVEELEEELQFHESLLNKMHEDLNKGVASHGTEEELWEVQRIVTQMKRTLRKAKSVQKQAAPKQQEDDKSDSVDQLSTDSKMDDGSSTGTDENKLTEGGEKDFKNEDITKEEEKPVVAADGEDVVAPTEAAEVKPVSPEEVTVEIEEEEDKVQPTKEKETKEEKQEQEEEDEEEVEEEEEESLESLYLYYSELTAKQEELKNIRSELQRRIEMEQLRLQDSRPR